MLKDYINANISNLYLELMAIAIILKETKPRDIIAEMAQLGLEFEELEFNM